MGRGRAKAKQTKVARELKYRNSSIDVAALQSELSTHGSSTSDRPDLDSDEDDDEYDLDGHYDVPDEDEDWRPARSRR